MNLLGEISVFHPNLSKFIRTNIQVVVDEFCRARNRASFVVHDRTSFLSGFLNPALSRQHHDVNNITVTSFTYDIFPCLRLFSMHVV